MRDRVGVRAEARVRAGARARARVGVGARVRVVEAAVCVGRVEQHDEIRRVARHELREVGAS